LLSNDVNIAFFIFVVSHIGAMFGKWIRIELQSFCMLTGWLFFQ
jgi:hypothetical protein